MVMQCIRLRAQAVATIPCSARRGVVMQCRWLRLCLRPFPAHAVVIGDVMATERLQRTLR
jgi:hypothetical protein